MVAYSHHISLLIFTIIYYNSDKKNSSLIFECLPTP
nr:MAG TPA: hypothetical protein [Caudoviricetes sp.]